MTTIHPHNHCRDYLDPLFEQLGQLCEKSDVYSLVRAAGGQAVSSAVCTSVQQCCPVRASHPPDPSLTHLQHTHPPPLHTPQGVIMVQLLFDSSEPREAKRVALHQIKSKEMHLPACLRDWPLASALAYGALALRCCNAGDRDARPTALEVADQLRQLLLGTGEAGTAGLQAGTWQLCAAPVARNSSSSGSGTSSSSPPSAAKVVALQLELKQDGRVEGTATVQLPQPQQPAAAPHPGPAPQLVAVAGEWGLEGSALNLKLSPGGCGGSGAAGPQQQQQQQQKQQQQPVKWPVEFEGVYSAGQLQGRWTYQQQQHQQHQQVGGGSHSKKSAAAVISSAKAGGTTSCYWFVSCKPAPKTGEAAAQATAAPTPVEGLAVAVSESAGGGGSGSDAPRCSLHAHSERNPTGLMRAL